jgi:hypothetical protein
MAKAGLVNDNSVTRVAGQSKNVQRTVVDSTKTSRTTTHIPTPISTIQGNWRCYKTRKIV